MFTFETTNGEITEQQFKIMIHQSIEHLREYQKLIYDTCSDLELDNLIHNLEELERVYEII